LNVLPSDPVTVKANEETRRVGERDFANSKADTAARRRLPRNRQVALDRNGRLERDAAHVEHDDAVRRADCVAERTRAGVVQIGDVENLAITPARCLLTKPG